MKTARTRVLDIAYEESGLPTGRPVVLIVGIAAYLILLGNLVPIPDPPAKGVVRAPAG